MKPKKIILITLCSLVFLIVVLLLSATAILSSERMRPTINKLCSSLVADGEVVMDTVSLSVFNSFPFLTLELTDGHVSSMVYEGDSLDILYGGVVPEQAKTILSFDKFQISLDLVKLLFGTIYVRSLFLDGTDIYAYISPWGKKNWEVFGEGDSQDSDSSSLDLSARRIVIRNSHLIYDDSEKMNSFEANIGSLYARGKLNLDFEKLELDRFHIRKTDLVLYMEESQSLAEVHIDSLGLRAIKGEEDIYNLSLDSHSNLMMQSKVYTSDFPFSINGTIGLDFADLSNYQIENTEISLAGSTFIFDGRVNMLQESIFTNLTCNIPCLDLKTMLTYLDPSAFPQTEGISTNLTAALKVNAQGRYETQTGRLPAITADVSIPGGGFYYPGVEIDVENLLFDGRINYDPYIIDSTSVVIDSLSILADGVNLDAKGKGTNIINDPHFAVRVKGGFDLTKLSSIFLKESGITAQGDVSLNAIGDFKISDLSLDGLGNTRLFGSLKTENLLVDIPADTIYTMLKGVTLNVASYTNNRDSLLGIGTQTIRVAFRSDSSDVKLKDDMIINLSEAKAEVKVAADGLKGDSTSVLPLRGSIEASRLRYISADSTVIGGMKVKADIDVLPSPDDITNPLIAVNTKAGRLFYRDVENRLSIRNGDVGVKATSSEYLSKKRRNDEVRRRRMEQLLDSLHLLYPEVSRDSLFFFHRDKMRVVDDFGERGNISFSLGESVADIMKKWEMSCFIKADNGRVTTPYFPLRNTLSNVNLSLAGNDLKLDNTTIKSGRSNLTLTGKVSGVRRALNGGKGKFRAELMVDSDTLDFNELMGALNASEAYRSADGSIKDSLSRIENEDQIQELLAESIDTSNIDKLLIVPGNIDLKLGLNVGYGEVYNIVLDKISGELTARDRNIHLKDLNAVTRAGDIKLTALYSTKSREDITTGFDLELKDVDVEKLVHSMPQIDTLLPMLSSLRGGLNCFISATAKMDTTMKIDMASLNGVGRIRGRDLVLLDGDTFSKISKLLMFKNKKRNLIDSLSMELLVEDSKVEIFPFILEMDRYVVGLSGIQRLNTDFDYHISVIKSPLLLKLGADVYGNFNDIKFKMATPLYRNTILPDNSIKIDEHRATMIDNLNSIVIPLRR